MLQQLWGVYYTLAVLRFLSVDWRSQSHLFGGLRLRNHRAVAENYNF